MPWFTRRSPGLVPEDLLHHLSSFGTASWAARLEGGPVSDPRFNWSNFFEKFLSAYRTNLPQALGELHAASAGDPMARYGAYRLVAEFDAGCTEPLFLQMMDAALQMMYEKRLASAYLTGYERDRWVDTHGDIRTSFDRLVEVQPPAPGTRSGLALGPGQSLKVATMGPNPLDNQFWIECVDANVYRAFSLRKADSDSTALSRYEESWVGTFDDVEGILRALGKFLRTPTHWCHPELDPYFTERRM